MGKAYENYATAQMLHTAAHNDWRRRRTARIHKILVDDGAELNHLGDGPAVGKTADWTLSRDYRRNVGIRADQTRSVKTALTKATEAALYLADAKAQYRQAKAVALGVAA